jgi:hypothetical protein
MEMYDWGNVIKAELDSVDADGNPKKAVAEGSYNATVSGVKVGKSKGGAFGVTLSFTIDGGAENGRTVKEGIYLTKKDGNPVPFGPSKLKRRLLNCGLTAEQITGFKFPKKETEMGDFKHILDAQVTITVKHDTIKDGDAAGLIIARVGQVAKRSTEAAA